MIGLLFWNVLGLCHGLDALCDTATMVPCRRLNLQLSPVCLWDEYSHRETICPVAYCPVSESFWLALDSSMYSLGKLLPVLPLSCMAPSAAAPPSP